MRNLLDINRVPASPRRRPRPIAAGRVGSSVNERSSLAAGWLLGSLLATSASATPVIATYGGHSLSTSSGVLFRDAAGRTVGRGAAVTFQNSVGSGVGPNVNVEDIAFDRDGNLYALGRPNGTNQRSIFRSNADKTQMQIVHEDTQTYDADLDGSIAVAPDGSVAVSGAGRRARVFTPGFESSRNLFFEFSPGTTVFLTNDDIEDLSYGADGTLYAIGRSPEGRTVYSNATVGGQFLEIEFHDFAYDAGVDASIAVFDVLAEANGPYVFNASNLDVVLDSTGSSGSSFEWQVGTFNASGEQVTLGIVDSGLTTAYAAPVAVDLAVNLSGTSVVERDSSQVSYENAGPRVASRSGTENADLSYTFDVAFHDPDLAVNTLIAGFEDLVSYELLFGADSFLTGSFASHGLNWRETVSRVVLDEVFGGAGTFTVDARVVDRAGAIGLHSFDITLSSASPDAVPEPSSLLLLGAGLAVLGLRSRQRTLNG